MKKLVSFVIAIAMIMAMTAALTVSSSAADTNFVEWDGKIDISWYNASAPETDYIIDTPQKLAGLADIANSAAIKEPGFGKDITFYITVNMDLKGIEWIPIGNANAAAFAGTLEGRLGGIEGKMITIKNFSIKAPAGGNMGLVGTQGAGGIKNIRLQNAYIESDKNTAGSFVGYSKFSDCVYENLISDATIEMMGSKWCGGIVAYANNPNITFKNCVYTGDITVYSNCINVGGLCGQITQNATVENVYVSSDIINYDAGAKYWGGIIGVIGDASKVYNVSLKNIQFDGTIMSAASQAGSIIGRVNAAKEGSSVSLENCLNTGLSWNNRSGLAQAVSWYGLCANYEAVLAINLTNCYSMSDVQLMARADYDASKNNSVFTVNMDGYTQVVTIGANNSLASFMPTVASFDNLKGDNAKITLKGFDFANDWATRDGKNPVLAFALPCADESHATADYSWFDSEKESGYLLTTENQVLALVDVLKIHAFTAEELAIDPALSGYAKTVLTDDWFKVFCPNGVITTEPVQTTEAPVVTDAPTEAPVVTEAPTEAPDQTKAPEVTTAPSQSGPTGDSTLIVAVIAIIAIAAVGTVVIVKRREN